MNPDSWSLWRAQVAAILRLEIKKNFLAKRGLWIYLLAAAPVALMWTHAMLNLRDHRVCDLGHDSLIFATMFQFFYLRFAIFFGCVGVFLRLFRGEMMEKSLHYYLLAPVRREVLLVGKYLAGVITTSIIFCTGTALTLLALLVHVPRMAAEQYLFAGGGMGHVLAYIGTTALACIAYGSVFLVMGFLFHNPVVPVVLVLLWEAANPFLPQLLKRLSVIFYLHSLLPISLPAQGDFAFLAILRTPMPAYLAVAGLLSIALAGLWLGARQVRKLEINYGTE
ncbi:MAG TPA: ABC transporter permease [Bryobacteraceae bacterium]|nr:ABC transporter permease [Bryobacteraceae bacterium]